MKSGHQFVFKILYIQDIVYYTLSGSSGTINLTRFLYQICRTCKSDENDYFYLRMTRSWLKNKANKTLKAVDIFNYKKQVNLVVKLNNARENILVN